MIRTLGLVFVRARDVLQTEGLVPLLWRGFAFLRRYLFQYGTYYLYEHTLKERNEADFMPRIQNFTFKIISDNGQADELAATTGFDLRRRFINAGRGLDKGAAAFCIFVDGELAHIGWVAMTEAAKNTFDSLPYRVYFSSQEACTGGTITIPKYERKGLMAYGYFKRFQFLREKGIIASRNAVATNNVASQRVHAKFGPRIYAKARYLRILRWILWKEIPLTQTTGD